MASNDERLKKVEERFGNKDKTLGVITTNDEGEYFPKGVKPWHEGATPLTEEELQELQECRDVVFIIHYTKSW